jgi:HK97 family phage prohead protease
MKKAKPTFKTYRVECKATEEDGVIDAFIPMSMSTRDRDEEVILPAAFEKTLPIFLKRPVLLSSHSYSTLTSQIGEFVDIKIKGKGLFAKPKYYINEGNPEADWAYKLAQHNMAAFSVGFIPKKADEGKSDKDPRRTYTEVELLEISQVTVPSNRDAIQGLKAKAVGVEAALYDEVLESDLIEKKPEETDLWIRIPVSEGHDDHKMRTITVSKEDQINALYCIQDKEIVTYLFSTDVWDMESAREWVEDHKKAFVVEVEPEPIVTTGFVQVDSAGITPDYILTSGNTIPNTVTTSGVTTTSVDPSWATSTIYIAPTELMADSKTANQLAEKIRGAVGKVDIHDNTISEEKAVTEGDIADDLDEIVTWFEQGGTLIKDHYSYAWKVVNALLKNAGPIPDDIRKQIEPIDIVTAARAAVMEILGGKTSA